MNWKKAVPAWILAFVLLLVVDWLIYQVLFKAQFPGGEGARTSPLWWAYIVGLIVFSFFFTFIYAKGYEGKGWLGEGFRYGLVLGLLIAAGYLIGYAFVKMTGGQVLVHMIGSLVKYIIAGWGVALVYKPES